MDQMYVVFLDFGVIKRFDERIWYDPKKAEDYFRCLYEGSDMKWVVLKVSEVVSKDVSGTYKCDWDKCPGVHPNRHNYCTQSWFVNTTITLPNRN